MNDRLLQTTKKVLRLLFDKNLHVNEIIRQTSPDRSYIISTIKTLEREGLIVRNKRAKKGKEIVKQLTELGRELVDMSIGLEQWKKSYFELRKAYEEKLLIDIDSDDDHIIRRILKNRGFTEDEINLYDRTELGISQMLYNCESDLMNTVICRYVLILFKFSLSDTAKNVLYDIIKGAVTFQLSLIMEQIEQQEERNIKNLLENSETQQLLDNIAEDGSLPVPVIMRDEIKNVMISRFSLLGLHKEHLEKLRETSWFRGEFDDPEREFDNTALEFCKDYINKISS